MENTRLPGTQTQKGRYTHPIFVEVETGTPIFVHRKGSNVNHGTYYFDYSDEKLLSHYGGKGNIRIEELKQEYTSLYSKSPDEVTADSPLKIEEFAGDMPPQKYYNLNRASNNRIPELSELKEIINSLDGEDRWLIKHGMTSHPYIGDGQNKTLNDEFASVHVGDETDTSPYRDTGDQEYLSTAHYIQNMRLLINYIQSKK